jgi:hypothetical protein
MGQALISIYLLDKLNLMYKALSSRIKSKLWCFYANI